MFWFGPISSLFDLITFAVLFFVVCPAICGAPFSDLHGSGTAVFVAAFQTGWFIESMLTQSLVVHTLRSRKLPLIGSRASLPVIISSLAGIALLSAVPYTPVGNLLGLYPLPGSFFLILLLIAAGYFVLATLVKSLYIKRYKKFL